jgi:MATE family multidrug resistance protein
MILVWHLDIILEWTDQDPRVLQLVVPYLHGLSACVLPMLFFAMFRNFVSALARPQAVMVITTVAVLVNYFLTLWLVHGGWGIPPLGLFGAGLATSIVSWLMFLALLWHVYQTTVLRRYGIFAECWKLDTTICKEIMVLGLPVAGLVFLEVGMFSAASILSGIIGGGSWLAFWMDFGGAGLWWGLAMGLTATGLLLAYRFHQLSKRLISGCAT